MRSTIGGSPGRVKGGAVYGYYLTFIDPLGMFAILISVQIILSLLVGGKARQVFEAFGYLRHQGLGER